MRKLCISYNGALPSKGTVSGNEEYKVNRKNKFDEPDVILETEDYILFIECKTLPFTLELLKSRSKEELEILKKDIQKSNTNINRYLEYRNSNPSAKEIIRMITYYEVNHLILNLMQNEVKSFMDKEHIWVVGIEVIEELLEEFTEPIHKILNDYQKNGATEADSILSFITSLRTNKNKKDSLQIIDKIAKETLGLSVS